MDDQVEDDNADKNDEAGFGRYLLMLVLVAVVVAVDQWTKSWAAETLPAEPITLIEGLLSLQYAENTGAAFSLFQGGGQLIGVLAVAAVVLIVFSIRNLGRRAEVIAVSLIAAGAIGNLVDRIINGDGFLDGFVVDFVRLWEIPNFNVADSALTVGATLLVALALFSRPVSQ